MSGFDDILKQFGGMMGSCVHPPIGLTMKGRAIFCPACGEVWTDPVEVAALVRKRLEDAAGRMK